MILDDISETSDAAGSIHKYILNKMNQGVYLMSIRKTTNGFPYSVFALTIDSTNYNRFISNLQKVSGSIDGVTLAPHGSGELELNGLEANTDYVLSFKKL